MLQDFIVREWLLLASLVGVVATSFYRGAFPLYTPKDVEPIFLLFALFVVVKGIENSNLLLKTATVLERGALLPAKLVIITFLLSMVVTIDVSLVTMLPIVLSLNVRQRENLAILVALTAHVGAALTPFGTPQNLFIYSFYDVDTLRFIETIAPFSIGMLLFFLVVSFFMKATKETSFRRKKRPVEKPMALSYLVLLGIVVLCVLRLLPVGTAVLALVFVLFFDRRSLKVDYGLLLTFLAFLGLTANIKEMIGGMIHHPGHIFILSASMSQFISNVPTTLLLNRFTGEWEALLWGTNVGGFGSLVAALANLITYKLYVAYGDRQRVGIFAKKFVVAGYVAFFVGFLIHFVCYDYLYGDFERLIVFLFQT
ncbi:hypothetical protein HCR_04440 [Hydrogenimonas cancrithermarum]|uniref:Citrate transporter-like domain-containing protein n=1 Tax=Hydrogenimonas cancrithermarum TaxID=2993563 RepID=A0ABM8FL41_9BACT|nr:hypothetical protein HCR_04440 [Hydrogenimonas cancrithermarum]